LNVLLIAHSHSPFLFRSLRSAFFDVFGVHRFGEINIGDVGQRCEPGEDIGEFAGQFFGAAVASLVFGDGLGQFADLFGEPQERFRRPAFRVGVVVPLPDQLLKRSNRRWSAVAHHHVVRCTVFDRCTPELLAFERSRPQARYNSPAMGVKETIPARAERFEDFEHDPVTVARRLLGQRLVRIDRGVRMAGLIVETEAYLGAIDRAAHTYGGRRTARNESMYLPGGFAYVYLTYGLHHCLNVVCGKRDDGVAVLIRAIQPTEAMTSIRRNRTGIERERLLCSGPGRLTKALNIDRTLDGIDLRASETLFIERARRRALPGRLIAQGPRIGIGYANEWARKPLRFFVQNCPYVSQ